MTGLGVFAGATMPIQALDSKPGKPASATVGSSGSTRLLTLLVTASAFMRPACTSGMAVPGTTKPAAIWPLRMAVLTCGLPG